MMNKKMRVGGVGFKWQIIYAYFVIKSYTFVFVAKISWRRKLYLPITI